MFLKLLPILGKWRICAICDSSGAAEAIEMITPGGSEDQNASSKRQMWAYLEHVAQLQYPPRNSAVSHHLDDGIWEFIKGDLRVLFFYDEGTRIVLTHGFIKHSQRTPPRQIVRAKKAMMAFLRAKKEDNLQFVGDK